jgi:hypothetical protein
MAAPIYTRPLDDAPTRHVFIGNCGPRHHPGAAYSRVLELLQPFGPVLHHQEGTANLWATLESEAHAAAAVHALHAHQPEPAARPLIAQFAATQRRQVGLGPRALSLLAAGGDGGRQLPCGPQGEQASRPVATAAADLGVPGLQLLHDFVGEQEEQELLQALDRQSWHSLAKRRVQHYGYRFDYTVGGLQRMAGLGAAADGRAQQIMQRSALGICCQPRRGSRIGGGSKSGS